MIPFEYLRVWNHYYEKPDRSATIDHNFEFPNVDDSQPFFQISADTLIGESKMLVRPGGRATRVSRNKNSRTPFSETYTTLKSDCLLVCTTGLE